jgi:hypothetical protein
VSTSQALSIVIVDDRPEAVEGQAAVLRSKGLSATVRTPDLLTLTDLTSADVIAVDQYFDWDAVPHPGEVAFWPRDGLAMSAVLESHLRDRGNRAALVLRTGQLDTLAAKLPKDARIPLLAAQRGLDWILTKDDSNEAAKLASLAAANAGLAPFRQGDVSWEEGSDWLGLSQSAWREVALAEVQVCRPPEHAVASYTTGTAWLRWFAHRILPFPTFLASDMRAATVMRVDLEQFAALVDDASSPLGERIRAIRYTGHLHDLLGRRWWRAGLDAFVDEILEQSPDGGAGWGSLSAGYSAIHGASVRMLTLENPVVTINSDYADIGVEEVDACVRLAPDLWPIFADDAWALREDAMDDDELGAMVSRGDRHRLATAKAME